MPKLGGRLRRFPEARFAHLRQGRRLDFGRFRELRLGSRLAGMGVLAWGAATHVATPAMMRLPFAAGQLGFALVLHIGLRQDYSRQDYSRQVDGAA